MVGALELSANGVNALSILLAGRNSAHTWWTGIVGCCLFGALFYRSRLYADATLQIFFVVTSAAGWWYWLQGRRGTTTPVRHTRPAQLAALAGIALAAAVVYAHLLRRYTDAYQPLADSLVLAGSVLGQFLLMARRVESWYCWLAVNTIAVPLFASRGLYLTALLYTAFWLNAFIALRHWTRLAKANSEWTNGFVQA